MHFPVVFIWFLLAIFIFRHHLRKNSKISEKSSKTFWEKEESSLVVKKHPLTDNDYIIPTLSNDVKRGQTFFDDLGLPALFRQQTYVFSLIDQPMVNFQTLSNADLRLKFGTATLTSIEAYEDNYTQYVQQLFSIAKILYDTNQILLATSYLEEGVTIGSDIKEHYLLLAKIYCSNNSTNRLMSLLDKARTLNSLTSPSLVIALEDLVKNPSLS